MIPLLFLCNSIRSTIILICIIALTFVTSGVLSAEFKKCLVDMPEVVPKKYAHYAGMSQYISLDMSSRVTHQLTTQVFRIFLQEVIGYEKVRIVENEDNFNITTVIDRLTPSTSDTPSIWINLEVWVPPDFDAYSKMFVKECGNVAPPGRFGWFIPNDMIKPVKSYFRNWRDDIAEVHWDYFKQTDMVKAFDVDDVTLHKLMNLAKSKETGTYFCDEHFCENSMYIPKQCKLKSCALLLTSDYNSTSFVKDTIDELKLLVKVIWLGPNMKTSIEMLREKYIGKDYKSMLILGWTPSDIIEKESDYLSVAFKHCELLNASKTSGCKYEMHRLVKFAWSKIQMFAQPLDEVLRVFNFKDEDYRFLLDLYEANKKHMSISEISCEWMKKSKTSWSHWNKHRDNKIFIGGIFPMTGSSYNGRGISQGAKMAKDAINANSSILPDYNLDLIAYNGECKADTVMKDFIDFIVDSVNNKKIIGVLGPACSDTVEPLAGVAKHYHMIVISYSAEGATFSDRQKYPYFFRTIGENQHYQHVYLKLMQNFKWRRVAALTEDGQKYTEYISSMQDLLEKNNITFITNKKFPREREPGGMSRYLQDLKSKRAKIIIADVIDSVARNVMCEAYKLEMTAYEGYVWFLSMWLNSTWYNTDYFNKYENENVNCTTEEMIKSITGYLSMTHAYYAPDDAIMQENKTVAQWKKQFEVLSDGKWELSNYTGFAYDAVWTYALALDHLSRKDPEALSDLHSENTTRKLVQEIEKTDFNGVSGRIKFRSGPSRFSVINIFQWYDNSIHLIGNFYPNLTDDKPEILGGTLNFTGEVRWYTRNKQVPDDGTPPPNVCALEAMANFFDVECTHAIIILNVIVAIVGIVFCSALCWHLKKQYDKKAQEQIERIKELEAENGLRYGVNLKDLDKWEVPRENVVINRKLGEGAFGTVYGGEAQFPGEEGWLPVAVKTLKTGSSPEEKLEFLSEADVMKRFEHPNIIRLLGVCTLIEPVYTIMEFMLYGDLKTFLLGRRHLANTENEEVSAKKLTSMALDVARGLSYLAEQKYVHRDVASRNCLVNTKLIVKLGDFGMTRPMFENDYYRFNRKGMLPVRWMSPESLITGVFSPASDVWAFGVLLYEIITFGSFPYQGKSNNEVLIIVKNGGTPTIPQGVKTPLKNLMASCWMSNVADRPTASAIVEYLATNPKLLEPCLDAPVSSVQLGYNDQVDITHLTEFKKTALKFSLDKVPKNGVVRTIQNRPQRQDSIIGEETANSIPLDNCCPKQPLLSTSRSNSSLKNLGLTKYVTIQHGKNAGCQEEEDEYVNSPPNGDIVTKV